jgi:hypothetical protein
VRELQNLSIRAPTEVGRFFVARVLELAQELDAISQ